MDLNIKTHQIELSDDVKDYLDKRMAELGKFVSEGTLIKGDIDLQKTTNHHQSGDIFEAKANLELPGKLLHASAGGDDIKKAIDGLKDELQQELKKYKELLSTKRRKGEQELKEQMHQGEV